MKKPKVQEPATFTGLYDVEEAENTADIAAVLRGAQLVTGDAVLLDVRPVSIISRTAAFLLDAVVSVVLVILLAVVTASVSVFGDDAAAAMVIFWVLVVTIGWPLAFETLTRGKSLGKFMMGTRVVRDDGGPVQFRQSLMRALMAPVELWGFSGFLAAISAALHPAGKRLGDMLAGTMVVSDRGATMPQVQFQVAPELSVWAKTVDIARLPARTESALRVAVLQYASLEPLARDQLFRNVFADVHTWMFPLPPAESSWVAVAQTVLAIQQARDSAMIADQARRGEVVHERLAKLPFHWTTAGK